MARAEHRQETTVATHGAHVYKLDTMKTGGMVRSTLRELVREGDFLSWSPFGGWSVTLATGGTRATAQAVAGCHARALELAPQKIAFRRDYLAAVAESDEARPVCSCGERITEAEVACQGGRCDSCAEEGGAK